MKPKNQWQLALWYLINWDNLNVKDVINDSMFYKFQARLSEIELEHGTITTKERKKFTNRFGKTSTYVQYSCTDKNKAKELFNLYN